ncbi:MAG: SUMF1/EgtB/PvdO family nonheme iron enzyme [Bryobacteraceae bacterium]
MNQRRTSLASARAATDALFGLIRPDSFYERSIPERHRLIFYLGHLEAFDWNLLCQYGLSVPPFHEEFDRLFAFGIDPGAGNLPVDKPTDWPSMEEVEKYNRRVREKVDELLGELPDQLICTAMEHRLMHAETFAYLLHNLPIERKIAPAHRVPDPDNGGVRPEMVEIPAGTATMGMRRSDGFGWDNEFDRHTLEVPAFAIGKYKVTNGEYLEYVRQGGEVPLYWTRCNGEWLWHGMFGEYPLPLRWPVYATHEQACGYALFAGKRLPSEAQFHRAAYGTASDGERLQPWGDYGLRGNLDFARWEPAAVDATPEAESAFGVAQMVGNGWEWTSSVFAPFPGFEAFPFYKGYSADFFDGEHYVLKGASPRTAGALVRRSFRNWFRPSYPYVYATFRLVT